MPWTCPVCGFTTPGDVSPAELPVHHPCRFTPATRPAPLAATPPPLRSDAELARLVAAYCASCPFWESAGCALDRGCRRGAWRAKARRLDYSCPRGKWREPLRVAFLTPGLGLGGAEIWVLTLAGALAPEAVRVTGVYVVSRGIHPWLFEQAHALHVPIRRRPGPWLSRTDIVISWGAPDPWRWLPDYHGLLLHVSHGCGPFARLVNSQIAQQASAYAAVSTIAARGLPPQSCILHNGVPPDRCRPRRSRAAMRSSWGVAPADRVALYCGRLAAAKRLQPLAQAAGALPPNWRVVLAGPQTEPGRLEQLQGAHVILADPIRHPGDALAAADVFVQTSEAEGMSLALCEAWMAGAPVAATRVGATPELEREYGPLVTPIPTPPEPAAVARAILMADSPEGRTRAARARRLARERLTAAAMARRWTSYLLALRRAKAC